ncbi:tubulin folding cofactor D C terminal-domain-containing protein [Podospora didyma]|uniref:Tubulin folding cofactor D C terminal-domain-containing protein n=1 Tax=Podospora didyma TaxID=330526 RepID=A0AAE0NZ66_9PEZI|nr:tubulin folding cofactor D C terminal-domain-containing protein [Podospora didyma]
MDAPEEDLDIKLHKASSDLIADFDSSLRPFLRKQDGAGGTVVRSRVRARETERLISSLLDPFQELPQLLDPHLPKWLPVLGDAFLEYQQTRRRPKVLSTRSELLMSLPTAICKILYTFCKIRGEKVIVLFLNNETKYLELLLSALEESERSTATVPWTWEERYVVLLWLSHLMLAPFDLSTISSMEFEDDDVPPIPGFRWPAKLPGITTRILPLAIKYLASPGKERDAAKALLVRISMRKDMQQLGVLDALVQWSLVALQPGADTTADVQTLTPYHYIGVLSYVSGILVSSADTSDMDRHLMTLFRAIHGAADSEEKGATPATGSIMSSALARKTMIKVIRAIAVLMLQNPQQDAEGMELVETTIGFLLENLSDNDTPVRLAASKALSVITLRLDAGMASQVVEAVLDSLNRNVIRVKDPRNPAASPKRDLSAVDQLEWHGLMLTLSHLLYRRSPPAENLSDIVHALLMGLSFEMRSASGGSIGTNVRDAACFGIWALARRYTTKELLAVSTTSASVASSHNPQASILQILATELLIAASLDPSGNIRRGSSAALQELIGRHPDTVEKGIWVVQAVDYHTVALRSRALQEVALSATKLSPQYGEALLDGLLGWRGIGDVDAGARRAAAVSYGMITAELASEISHPVKRLARSASLVLGHLKALQTRQVEERHGLLLSFAAVLDSLPAAIDGEIDDIEKSTRDEFIRTSTDALLEILRECDSQAYRRPELIAEAASRLVISSFPLLQTAVLLSTLGHCKIPKDTLLPGPALASKARADISQLVVSLSSSTTTPSPQLSEFITLVTSNLGKWLVRPEVEIISAASEAGLIVLIFSPQSAREAVIRGWVSAIRRRPSSSSKASAVGGGYFFALVMSYSIISTLHLNNEDKDIICDALRERWDTDSYIDARVAILQSLTGSEVLRENMGVFLGMVKDGLDDYTSNARGDVGSHVRLQALKATKGLWDGDDTGEVVQHLFFRVLRLAAEKLDRVRVEAQSVLGLVLKERYAAQLRTFTFSSKTYFRFLLDLLANDWHVYPAVKDDADKWMEELMAGFVSSADTGNEDLVIATRAAMCDFCSINEQDADAVCAALVRNLKSRAGQDRILVPTLEVIAFLFHVGIFSTCRTVDYKNLCLLVQKAGYKTGNVRKIEACVKVYGAIAASQQPHQEKGIEEARKRLAALMVHPWPHVRNRVIDELWALTTAPGTSSASDDGAVAAARLKGVDWGRADKGDVRAMVEALGLTAT